ncbi:hypothetical protein ACFLSA_02440 [Bacteroidota bacterium]
MIINSKFSRYFMCFLLIVITGFFLSSCADVIPIQDCLPEKEYGFWSGLLHGLIAPFSFIISLFKDDVAVYAVNNKGHLYDLGFVLGAAIIFGGGGNASKSRKS